MLKTNTKQARENIKSYILKNFRPEDYAGEFTGDPQNFDDVKKFIIGIFKEEYADPCHAREKVTNFTPDVVLFTEWAQGLPLVLDCDYYVSRSAIDDLGDILEETPEERRRFSERQAEATLTWLIFRELDR